MRMVARRTTFRCSTRFAGAAAAESVALSERSALQANSSTRTRSVTIFFTLRWTHPASATKPSVAIAVRAGAGRDVVRIDGLEQGLVGPRSEAADLRIGIAEDDQSAFHGLALVAKKIERLHAAPGREVHAEEN